MAAGVPIGVQPLEGWLRPFAAAPRGGDVAVGAAVSFAVALLVVRWTLAAIGRVGFAPFGWYRIALGAAVLLAAAAPR